VKLPVAFLLATLALGSCGKKEGENAPLPPARQVGSTANGEGGVTPMAQRVAVLGILNKRNGIVQTVRLHPGQSVRWKDAIVRLRACEATAPWEDEKLTGALVASVEFNCEARDLGIVPGDVITATLQAPVTSPDDVHRAIQAAHEQHRPFLALLVQGQGGARWVSLSVDPSS